MAEQRNSLDEGAGVPMGEGAHAPGMVQLDPQAWIQWMQSRDGSQGSSFTKLNKDFISLGGCQFDGKGDAVQANEWVIKCEHVFRVMELTSVMKRQLAVQNLVGPALLWWRALESGIDLTTFSWEQFCERLSARFVSKAAVKRLAKEFLELKQGDMSVTEYVNKFNELAPYAPLLVSSEALRNTRFIDGLKESIGIHLVPYYDGGSFDRVLDLALRYEYREEEYARENPGVDCLVEAPERQLVVRPREAARVHGGSGKVFDGCCLNCGQMGHTVRRCPMPNQLIGRCYRCGLDGHRSRDCPN